MGAVWENAFPRVPPRSIVAQAARLARRAVPPVIAHTLALGGIGAHTMPGTIVHSPLVVLVVLVV